MRNIQKFDKIALVFSLLIIQSIFSQPIVVRAEDPVAKLTGPDQKPVGSLVIISAKGSVGENFAFQCLPKNDNWQAVKFFDGDFGIIFSSDKPGTYYFFMAASNKEGKIATDSHQVVIGKPGPLPPPDPDVPPDPDIPPKPIVLSDLAKRLDAVLKTDLASGVGTKDQLNKLAKLYKAVATTTVNDKTLTKAKEVWNVARAAAAEYMPEGALPQLRTLLAKIQTDELFKNYTIETALTDAVRAEMAAGFEKLYKALDEVVAANK